MPQHKAPTAVTIAPTAEKSPFTLWVERYWKFGAGITLVVVAWILYQSHAKTAKRVVGQEGWAKLLSVTSQDPSTRMLLGSPEDLLRIVGEVEGTPAGPWSLYLAATSAAANREFDKAVEALAELRKKHPSHPLVAIPLGADENQSTASIVKQLEDRIESQRTFIREHPGLFDNPALPPDAPRVRLSTEHGVIVVGLYSNLAPKHVENFLKLVRDGAYNGTKFHAVVNGEYIQGGDPDSVKGEPQTWGKGGPGYSLEKEASGLRHFPGVISSIPDPQDSTKSSGSQFLITSSEVHSLDETYSPFGRVLEGLDVVRGIERLPLAEKSFTQPKEPASVISAEIP